MTSLFGWARECLETADPTAKVVQTRAAQSAWLEGRTDLAESPLAHVTPGYPASLRWVRPRDLPRRSLTTTEGRAALIHAVAHIEFNAINLAWDAVYRFRAMPREYYSDWLQVAVEEAYHFELLSQRLADLGFQYGDFPAHNGLWQMAEETAYDVLARMALVPRVLEARGLDVTPDMMARLRAVDDEQTVAILTVILNDEIGHVLRGTRWFRFLCQQRDLHPVDTFLGLINRHLRGVVKGPFNIDARLLAGFTQDEMDSLARISPLATT